MAISKTEALDIAAKHGLSLIDGMSLATLADDADEAESIAARFAGAKADNAEPDYQRIADDIREGVRR